MRKRCRIINPAQLEFELSLLMKPTASLLSVSIDTADRLQVAAEADEEVIFAGGAQDEAILADEAVSEMISSETDSDEPVFLSLDEVAVPSITREIWLPQAGFALPTTMDDRLKANHEAICVYEDIRDNGMVATDDQKRILAMYTGYGGMNPKHGGGPTEHSGREVKTESFEEYPAIFLNGIRSIIQRNAPNGANVLFAGCAAPVVPLLFGESFARNSRIAVHAIDPMALGIAKILIPDARFYEGSVAAAPFPDEYFHLAFYGGKTYESWRKAFCGDLAIATAQRLALSVAPGGIIATNFARGELSGQYSKNRDLYNELSERVDFRVTLAAKRIIPKINTGFYSRDIPQEHEFFLATKHEEANPVPSIFSGGPNAPRYGSSDWAGWANPDNQCDFADVNAIANRTLALPDTVFSTNYVVANSLPIAGEPVVSGDAVPEIPFGGYKVTDDGTILHNRDGAIRPMEFSNLAEKKRLLDLIAIQDTGRKTYALRYEADINDFQTSQRLLKALCDKYVEDYYALASPQSLQYFVRSSDSGFLLGLSNDYQAAQQGQKDNIFSCEHAPIVDSAKPATLMDAYKRSYRSLGRVDLEHIGNLFGVPESDRQKIPAALGGAIFLDVAQKEYVPAEIYLSGDVIGKLEEAKKAAEFDKSFDANVQALEKVAPAPLTLDDISLGRCAPWMNIDMLRGFTDSVIRDAQLSVSRFGGVWELKVNNKHYKKGDKNDIYATRERSGVMVMRMVLKGAPSEFNQSNLKIPDGPDGKPIEGAELEEFIKLKREEYALIKEKFKAINASFKSWVEQEPDRLTALQADYNRALNRYVPYTPPAHSVSLKGMSPAFKPDAHQISAVAKAANMDSILLNHFTGSGKSFVLAGVANERLTRGQNHKIALVVPRATLTQLAGEIARLFPELPVHIVGPQDITGESPSVAYQRAVKSSRSLVLFTYETFLDVPDNKGDILSDLAKQRKAAERDAAVATNDTLRKPALKRISDLDAEIKKVTKRDESMPVDITQAGFDGLMADEAHLLRNLHASGPGFEQANGNDRTADFYRKVQQLRKRTPRLFTAFATGTVGGRKASDIYNLMRYLAPQQLNAAGVHSLGDFLNIFAVRDIMTKVDVKGNIKNYYGYELMPSRALANLLNSFTDTVFEDDVPRVVQVRPKYRNEEQERVTIPQSPGQEKIYQEILAAVDKKGGGKLSGDHLLTLYQKSIRAAIDPRLVDPEADAPQSGKIIQSVERACDRYHATHDNKGTQLIFCDMYSRVPRDPRDVAKQYFGVEDKKTPEGQAVRLRKANAIREARRIFRTDAGFNVYHEYRKELINRGIPKNQICIIGEVSDSKKDDVYEKFRKGDIRFLLGSRALVGTGMNIQDRIVADHYLDIPWNPEQQWQATGRARRPGNMNSIIDSYIYLTEKSPEAIVSSRGEAKIRATSAIFRLTVRESSYRQVVGMIGSAAELTAVIRGDDRYMAMSRLDTEISLLRDSIGAAEHSKLLTRRSLMSLQYDYDKSKESMEAQAPVLKVIEEAKASGVLFKHDAFEGGLDGPTVKYFEDMRVGAGLARTKVVGIKIFGFDAEFEPGAKAVGGDALRVIITPEEKTEVSTKKLRTVDDIVGAFKKLLPNQHVNLSSTEEAMLDVFLNNPGSISKAFQAKLGNTNVVFDPTPTSPKMTIVTTPARSAYFRLDDYKTTQGLFTSVRAKMRGYQGEYDYAKDSMQTAMAKLQSLGASAAVSGDSGRKLFDIVRARDAIETDIKTNPNACWKRSPDEGFGVDSILQKAQPLVHSLKGQIIEFDGVVADSVPTLLIAHANARYYSFGHGSSDIPSTTAHALECAKSFLAGSPRADAPDDFKEWGEGEYRVFAERAEKLVAIPPREFRAEFYNYQRGVPDNPIKAICEEGILTLRQAVAQHEEQRNATLAADAEEATLIACGGEAAEPSKGSKSKGRTK